MQKNNSNMKTTLVTTKQILLSCVLLLGFFTAPVYAQQKASAPTVDIHTAAMTGNMEAIRQHLAAGTDLNTRDPFGGSTPLITAIVFGKNEVAKALIDVGTNLNLKNNDGSTALHCAAFFTNPEITKLLLAKGVDKTIKNNYGSTARDIVLTRFDELRPVYEMQEIQLGAFGLKLDYAKIQKERPIIAELLK